MNKPIDKIPIFINRMGKIGIEIDFFSVIPWVYINKINNKKVIEKFESEHGFTIGYLPIRSNEEFKFTDITEIFKLIRKYK